MIANYLIESIDETVEPCDDFYHFVCGTWIKNTRIPDDGKRKTFKIINKFLKIIFSWCRKYIQFIANSIRLQYCRYDRI